MTSIVLDLIPENSEKIKLNTLRSGDLPLGDYRTLVDLITETAITSGAKSAVGGLTSWRTRSV
jgi:hypothetical protein